MNYHYITTDIISTNHKQNAELLCVYHHQCLGESHGALHGVLHNVSLCCVLRCAKKTTSNIPEMKSSSPKCHISISWIWLLQLPANLQSEEQSEVWKDQAGHERRRKVFFLWLSNISMTQQVLIQTCAVALSSIKKGTKGVTIYLCVVIG